MEENKELDERKLMILKAVIDDYIQSFEPVGSRTIARKYDMGLSSATIRENPALAAEIVGRLEDKMTEYSKLIKACAEIVSDMTHYIAIGSTHGRNSVNVKAIQIVPVDETSVLTVVVADTNTVKSKLVSIPEPLGPERVIELSGIVNRSFSGKPTEMISLMTVNRVADESGISRNTVLPITDGIFECIKQCETDEFFTEGAAKLLKSPEFDNIDGDDRKDRKRFGRQRERPYGFDWYGKLRRGTFGLLGCNRQIRGRRKLHRLGQRCGADENGLLEGHFLARVHEADA